MNPSIQFKTTVPTIVNSIGRSPLQRVFLLIPLALAWIALSPRAQAQLPSPTPDGGYPNENTAEGSGALFSLTTGVSNTATGFDALYSNTSGSQNTANGDQALFSNTTGSQNTANGYQALFSNTMINGSTGDHNTANGAFALQGNTIGSFNTANGASALLSNKTGSANTAAGVVALSSNTTGSHNTASGESALNGNTTGSDNIALGYGAGANLTTGDSNIDIGNDGVAGEADAIRIGTQGTQTRTFIAGISGTALGNGVAVRVNANGRLGTAPSSERFKQNIKPMDKASEAILALKPVTFHYKKELDPDGVPQFGLVAEEVEKVSPDLVARDDQGKVYTVRYEAVNAMLLNEFLKQHKAFLEEHRTVQEQQKEIDALRAELRKQKTLIQKVSDKVEMTNPAPQMVVNDQ